MYTKKCVKEGDHLERLGVDGKIILKCIFEKWNGNVWNKFVSLRDEWSALVNTVTDLPSSKKF
jgi:hypothetical protein